MIVLCVSVNDECMHNIYYERTILCSITVAANQSVFLLSPTWSICCCFHTIQQRLQLLTKNILPQYHLISVVCFLSYAFYEQRMLVCVQHSFPSTLSHANHVALNYRSLHYLRLVVAEISFWSHKKCSFENKHKNCSLIKTKKYLICLIADYF